ncbi:hypothetical protein BCR43DRAFT_524762 [Syncephalastrum racemosum]|uniref:Uncharacterized protein n=1 Tax=Syncephalastrum racemosum TaxID=13706 RepID=A0A1X2HD40_SYNRA|nr:hypothetical protein BCR43DRAFT_524762 [Syncephalastrum racemosum]
MQVISFYKDQLERQNANLDKSLPLEYNEDDVRQGRLRYSKLFGNNGEVRVLTEEEYKENVVDLDKDVVPALARRRAEERAKEDAWRREGEEAIRKAMERKMKIEEAKLCAKKRREQQQNDAEDTSVDPSTSAATIVHPPDATLLVTKQYQEPETPKPVHRQPSTSSSHLSQPPTMVSSTIASPSYPQPASLPSQQAPFYAQQLSYEPRMSASSTIEELTHPKADLQHDQQESPAAKGAVCCCIIS